MQRSLSILSGAVPIPGVLALVLCHSLVAFPVLAHDALAVKMATQGDMARADWFKSLKQPDTGLSCCDISDCRKTDANWKEDGWWATVRGIKRPIPQSKVVKKPFSIDGEAYVCASETGRPDLATIYCFIPPNMAM